MDHLILSTFQELQGKVRSFSTVSRETTIVALGSSHGGYGFNPHLIPGSFNFCTVSQDLKHSSLLYEWLNKRTGIRTLIIFYSIFSPGFSLEKSAAKMRCVAYKKVFDLDITYDEEIESSIRVLDREIIELNHLKEPERGFVKSNDCFFYNDEQGIEPRAAAHVKHALRNTENPYLKQILSLARTSSQKVLLVVPPARSDYREYCRPTFDIVHKNLIREIKDCLSDCILLNLFDDADFTDSFFGDGDHLYPDGPGTDLVTCKIRDVLDLSTERRGYSS